MATDNLNPGVVPRRSARSALTWSAVAWGLAAVLLGGGGAAWIAQQSIDARRDAFETDARIAHRVLSQRMVQHDAVLATLALLDAPDAPQARDALQRLPALYPQVLRVLRRGANDAWPPELAAALSEGEARSRRDGRAALVAPELAAGRYWLVRAGGGAGPGATPPSGAAFALQFAVSALLVPGEWPLQTDSPVRAVMVRDSGPSVVLARGDEAAAAAQPWRFDFAKHLASPSQPFDLRLSLGHGWAQLPWGPMLAWVAASVTLLAGAAAGLRQRAGARRAQELLRLGQVGRLNALGELAAGIAHELNQPLTAVMANTAAAGRLLADDEPDVTAVRTAMHRASQQARRAADVLGRLRRLIERPDATPRSGPQRVQAVLASALDLRATELRAQGVRVHSHCEPPTLMAQADPVALEQIVHNLLANAQQALVLVPEAERRLDVGAMLADGRVRIAVQDSGPGIAPEALPRLFEPFFTTRDGGLGLGLSLCETLAAGMGGTLAAANAAPRGAVFTLSLPAAAAEGAAR